MKKTFKKLAPIALTFLLGWFLLRGGFKWSDLSALLAKAKWGWLLLGLFWQASAYASVTWLNKLLLERYGAKVPFGKQYLIQLAMAFIEAAVPTASVSGAVLRVRLLKPHGVSGDVATATTVAEMGLIAASVILLALPVAVIAVWQGIFGAVGLSTSMLVLLVLFALTVLTVFWWHSPASRRTKAQGLQTLSKFWDERIRTRWSESLGDWTSQKLLERLDYLKAEAINLLRERPLPIILSLLARSGFEALGLAMCFFALGQLLPLNTILLIYTLTLAVNTLGALPGGIGLAEISLTTLYAHFGISAEMALAIALAYRLTDYWLPRLVGGVAWLGLEYGSTFRLSGLGGKVKNSHPRFIHT